MPLKPGTAGYSGAPLLKKLGIKPGMSILAINAPSDYLQLLGDLPEGVKISSSGNKGADLVHWFVMDEEELVKGIEDIKSIIPKNGAI